MRHIVMTIFCAKPGKESELKENTLKIAECSRQQQGCIAFHVCQDPHNLSQFGIYEQWESQELYQEQFKRPYIVEFMGRAQYLLEEPYSRCIGNELSHEMVAL